MANYASAGVRSKEIDLSTVITPLGAAIGAFAGKFTKGFVGQPVAVTSHDIFTQNFGFPTNSNFNDWFQVDSFLKYSGTILVSRVVDVNGTFTSTTNTVTAVNELGKVEVQNVPSKMQVGSLVRFATDAEDQYMITAIEAPVEAQKQVDTLTIDSVADTNVYTLNVSGTDVSYTANDTDTTSTVATELGDLLEAVDASATNISVSSNIITITASVAGVAMDNVNSSSTIMTLETTTENVPGESYELVFDDATDFTTIANVGAEVLVKDFACNPFVEAAAEGTVLKTAAELYPNRIFIGNETDYASREVSIPVSTDSKIKFIAKSCGDYFNGTEIAIAREADFASGEATAFTGISLNELFIKKPLESKKEIAIAIRVNGEVKETFIVSLIEGTKDAAGKSVYIENVLNKYSTIVYAKDNTSNVLMPESRIASLVGKSPIKLSNGSEGLINAGDYIDAYEVFANKEEVIVDSIIAAEANRTAACAIADTRKDSIAFAGSRYEDCVGISSTKAVSAIVEDAQTGEMNNNATSYCALYGNYVEMYDKYNDKNRWVSVAGHAAGLRAQANENGNVWDASAGLQRGALKGINKLAFVPNAGQRELIARAKANIVTSFPGKGNVIWGQYTMTGVAGSAFTRINVRSLFNFLKRSVERAAQNYVFEINDSFTRSRFTNEVSPFLAGVKAGRGVYDFYVQCDETNNTAQSLDNNEFNAALFIKPSRTAEFINLSFVAVGTGTEFSEVVGGV